MPQLRTSRADELHAMLRQYKTRYTCIEQEIGKIQAAQRAAMEENQQQKSRKEALDSAIRKAREEAVAVDADVAHAEQELATVKASMADLVIKGRGLKQAMDGVESASYHAREEFLAACQAMEQEIRSLHDSHPGYWLTS
ncbi:hypothetical protein ACKKBG_A27040 [Auxenochlorella protothecoides x Auxenochlorella symbiontica]